VAQLAFYEYLIGTGVSSWCTTAGKWSCPLTSIRCRGSNLLRVACISTSSICLNFFDTQNIFILHVAKSAEGNAS
jgi:hypothetical protein